MNPTHNPAPIIILALVLAACTPITPQSPTIPPTPTPFVINLTGGDSAALVEAVQSAVRWFEAVKLLGIRQVIRRDPTKPRGFDKFIVKDPHAPPLWARFYEIGTNRPIFCSRDGVVRYRLADISYERRTGYAWYGTWPARLLARDYPAWQKRWAPGKNVLTRGQGRPRR